MLYIQQLRHFLLLVTCVLVAISAAAQRKDPLAQARNYKANGQVDSALNMYYQAYQEEPFNFQIYQEYYSTLNAYKRYDEALLLAEYMSKIKFADVGIWLDIVAAYEHLEKKKQARKTVRLIEKQSVTWSEYQLRKNIGILQDRKKNELAIHILENVIKDSRSRTVYSRDLARLYLQEGMFEKGVPYYINNYQKEEVAAEFKALVLPMVESDESERRQLDKTLKKALKDFSGQVVSVAAMQTWLAQISGGQNKSLEQLIQMDRKSPKEYLQQILDVSKSAQLNRSYATARKGYQYLIDHSEANSRDRIFFLEQLCQNNIKDITHKHPVDLELVKRTVNTLEKLYLKFPLKKAESLYLSYTDLLAKQLQRPEDAIDSLEKVLMSLRLNNVFIGHAKLALGDYALLAGRVWDANLYYAQVDKLFKQDKLGEDARYKQAKLAFYRGDFKWSQQQLNILKASTAELISNDAMQLSIMISENTTMDTTAEALKHYAKADLKLFQQQYDSAKSLLEDFHVQFPEHELKDDVWMLQARLAKEEGDYALAVKYYNRVLETFKEDVLADDAVLQLAMLHEDYLKDKDKAKLYYETLIIDYENSTLVAIAREQLQQLKSSEAKPQ